MFVKDTLIVEDITLTAEFGKQVKVYYRDDNDKQISYEYVFEGEAAKQAPTFEVRETEKFITTFDKWVTEVNGTEEADLSCITGTITVWASFKQTPKITDIRETVDFVLEVETGRDIRILQLTDTQIIDWSQNRGSSNPHTSPTIESEIEENCFKYIRQAIERSDPDLILLTGDIVYGSWDDEGTSFEIMVDFFESLNIPWAPVFGNHDNETEMGTGWQCDQFQQAENCLFKRGNLTGNGNYSIGIMQGGKLAKVVYMMDSNGTSGFGDDQKEWLDENAGFIDVLAGYSVSKFIAFHVPIAEFAYGAYESGYQTDADFDNEETYTIGETVPAKNGDFGCKGEWFKGLHEEIGLWKILKDNHFDGVFVGHSHCNNVSILYDGIRLTFGLKGSTYDRYTTGQLGGTLITVAEGGDSFVVEHIYYDSNY